MRNIKFTFFVVGVIAILLALPAFAQVPTGTITGTVTYEGSALPGVTITATSPNLMQARRAVSQDNGDYIFRLLPPGEYVVSFELGEFQTLETSVLLPAAQSRTVDAKMSTESLSETLEVTASLSNISSNSEASATMAQDTLEKLPIGRTLTAAVTLQAGVTSNGPNGGITISGSQSYENLFMINGVVVSETIRGQPIALYIEDAVQETTTTTSGVSAEYGRFSGGVVNTITKSGGNEFSGSFRVSFDNDDWTDRASIDVEHEDVTNETFEATLGGFAWKDKVWFFLAGRDRETDGAAATILTNIPISQSQTQDRYEAKLTLSPHPNHRIVGSYFERETVSQNSFFGNAIDASTISDRKDPIEGNALNYTGVLTDNFFVEAQYSKRDYSIGVGSGGDTLHNTADPVNSFRNGAWSYELPFGLTFINSPVFCGVCGGEKRDNENYLVKASYFLSTDSMGSHEFVGGYDTFDDIRQADNHQSSSGFSVINFIAGDVNGSTYTPVFLPGAAWVWWTPILEESLGTSFVTNSLYINDTWRFNENFTFNIGMRYDENDGVNSAGQAITDDSKTSPRLGMSWDVKGDGDWIVNASYGEYVSAIANGVADDSSPAGNPAIFSWVYGGPSISGLATPDAMAAVGQWFFDTIGDPEAANCVANNFDCDPITGAGAAHFGFADIPGVSSIIEQGLASPASEEISLGITKRLGNRGIARVDYVHRDYNDFYASIVDTTTGADPNGITDLAITRNEDSVLKRAYDGIHSNLQYRLNDKFTIGANYTWSEAIGNHNGETGGSGPVTSGALEYPEFKDAAWNNPVGFLGIDQRHKVRAWGIWDVWTTNHHSVNFSALTSFNSGSPYGAIGDVQTSWMDSVTDPGYLSTPDTVNYYFTSRHAFRTDDFTRTDLSLNYGFFFNAMGRDIEVYFQPELLNVFNETNVLGVNTNVITGFNHAYGAHDDGLGDGAGLDGVFGTTDDDTSASGTMVSFDPHNTAPVECVTSLDYDDPCNWSLGNDFGDPTSAGSFQNPRTFRFSIGVRF